MTPQQGSDTADARHLLRRAALAEPTLGLAAWQAWRSRVDAPQLDPAAQRWFPLVWWNLRHTALTDAERRWLSQSYQDAWLRNQHHLSVVGATVDALERAGITTVLLKGAALALAVYERVGLRPFGDVDVLVPTAAAEAARDLLHQQGWTPIRHVAASSLSLRHGVNFTNGKGVDLDLHWVSLADSGGDGLSDHGFWQRAVPWQMPGATSRVLSPADQLLHVCVHGAHWAHLPTEHWQADAVTVIRRAGEALEWDTLVTEARERRMSLQVTRALDRLVKEHHVEVPAAAHDALRRSPHAWWERAEHRAKQHERTIAPLVVQAWCATARRRSLARQAGSFVDDLRAMTGVTSAWDLVPLGAARACTRQARTVYDFTAFGLRIRLDAQDSAQEIIGRVLGQLPPFTRTRSQEESDRSYTITVHRHDDVSPNYYRIEVGERLFAMAGTVDEAASHIATDLQTYFALAAPGVAFVHAGVVAIGGRGLMVPGSSLSGKSTLIAALLRAGATYLSDECAVIGTDGRVAPYARPLVLRTDGGQVRTTPGELGARTAEDPVRVDAVLFTQFTAGLVFSPERLSSADAMLRLLAHCPGAQVRPVDTLARLRTLTSTARAWATPRGDADETARALMNGACFLTS